MEIISRSKAKKLALRFYFTGKPCPHGHIAERRVSSYCCVMCTKDWYHQHKEDILAEKRQTYSENRESKISYAKQYYCKHKEYIQKYKKKYAEEIYYERLRITGRGKFYTRNYYTKKMERCPIWADMDKIKDVYTNCPVGMQVDHIYPIQGKLISGLHVHDNLQYLPITDNRSKGNRFEPIIGYYGKL